MDLDLTERVAQATDQYGAEVVADIDVNAQIWGTPEEMIAKHEEHKAIVGEYAPTMVFQHRGLEGPTAADRYELFTSEVLPALQKL